ncbi:translocation/assembly module TamB domain-containing protein [Oceanicaulis sp. UBA2681]|uniref:translocation/assembly module TamB domain-containing protein n=1 Tax=Oceanicaulis sp. UBA2681 TaxID=1947007 RepID=UPI00257E96B0|nr:translocation/assembly module TamB domain-containing protein [Oceanicaulis sp. UBA2681]
MRASTLLKTGLAILVIAAVLVLAGLVSLRQAPGRALVSHLVDGRRVDAVGVVHLAGLQGDVLSDFSVEQLTLSDEQGVWLEADNVRVGWRARSLLGPTVAIEAVEADRIVMHRRPDLERADASQGGASRGVRLNQLLISELVLEAPVLGERAALRAEAALTSSPEAGQSLRAEIVRIDGASDRLVADLTRNAQGVIAGQLSAHAEADSPLADLVYASGRGFELEATINGTPQAGQADYSFVVGEIAGLEGRGLWEDGAWRLEGLTDADAWPELPANVQALLSGGTISGEGALDPLTGRLAFSSDAGELSVSKAETPLIDLTGRLSSDGLSLFLPQDLSIQEASVQAQLNRADRDAWLSGDVQARGVEHSQIEAEHISARFVVGRQDSTFSYDVNGEAQTVRWENARAGAALGDQISFIANGAYDRNEQTLQFETSQLQSEGVAASAAGAFDLMTRAFQGRVSVALDDAGRIQDGLSGPVMLEGVGDEAGLSLTVQADSLTGEGVPYVLASGLSGQGRLSLTDGLALTDLDVEGRYLRLSGDIARTADASSWQGAVEYAVDAAAFDVASLSGVIAGAAELDQDGRGLTARLQAQADALSLGGVALERPMLRIEIAPSQTGVAGDWRFDAASGESEVLLQGDLDWSGQAGRIGVRSGQYADVVVQGEARLLEEAVELDFTAEQDGAIELWSASLAYQASRTEILAGRLDLSAALEGVRVSGVTVNAADVRLSGPLDALTFDLNAEGAVAEPFNVSVSGPVAYADGRAEAVLDVSGEVSGRRLASPGPLSLDYENGDMTVAAQLALDQASLTFRAERAPEAASISYDFSALPADLIMGLLSLPQGQGDLQLAGDFSRADGRWTGQSRLAVSDLSSATDNQFGALNGAIELELTPDQSRLNGQFAGTDLDIGLDLTLPGAVTGSSDLSRPDWRGDLNVNGDVAVLAGLYLPEGEILRGILSVDASIEGMETSGVVTFTDGALSSAIAGRSFEPINAQGGWRNGALVIESLRVGEDAKSGANAQAEFRMTEGGFEGEGRIELNRLHLVDRPELSGGASGYADFTLSERVLTVTGEADVQRLDVRPSAGGNGGPSIPQIEVVELNRPDSLDRAYRRPIRLELDYHLRADDRLFVSSRAFTSEWSADVHVTGTATRPNLSGQATLIAGQASLLTAPFTLTTGRVTFDGPVNQSRVAIEALHETSDLTVIGRVEGSVRAPEVSFESTPSLPEDEILSRLLFGSGVSDLSPLQASQLAAQLSGAGWLDAMAGVRAVLGMDRLDVRQNGDGAVSVLGGRQLTEDVYLELETGVGQALGAARIEWRLSPSFVLASEVSGDSSNEISLSWRRSFD